MKKNKILIILLSLVYFVVQNVYVVSAQALPTVPSAPTPPSQPSTPVAPIIPTPPAQPTIPSSQPNQISPTPTSVVNSDNQTGSSSEFNNNDSSDSEISPTPSQVPTKKPKSTSDSNQTLDNTSSNTNTGSDSNNVASNSQNSNTNVDSNNQANLNNAMVLVGQTGWNDSNRNTGDAEVITGSSNLVGTIENQANQTLTSLNSCVINCGSSNNQSSSNNNTGANSDNLALNEDSANIIVTNNNYAVLNSDVIAVTDTGHNQANKNTGNAYVETGDANVGLTVVNVANTDILGIQTTEFDVFDDHKGDIIIDIASLNSKTNQSSNADTGSDSSNTSSTNSNTSLTFINTNNATVANDLVIDAVTGKNEADKNTGNGSIVTGDANVMANVVNLVNSGITAGTEVLIATVNVFGDWVGNLIFTDSNNTCSENCTSNNYANNNNTGSNSNNVASSDNNVTSTKITDNNALINNGLYIGANTGRNEADNNTGGSSIESGEVNVSASQTNVVNTNLDDGTWWLVVVNDAGRWIGQIIGADGKATGQTVDLGTTNNNTGADSNNEASSSNNSDYYNYTSNNAEINNQIIINADTGNNSAERNSGSGSIKTGDVNVSANIVNFVNTNFSGSKVVVAFVNVFGSWVGDVITPGGNLNRNNADKELGGVVDSPIIIDDNFSIPVINQESSNSSNDYKDEANSPFNLPTEINNDSLSSKKNVLSAQSYQSQELSDRIANGEWIVEVDPTISVTPSPVMAGLNENSNESLWKLIGVWLLVSAGLGVGNIVRKSLVMNWNR